MVPQAVADLVRHDGPSHIHGVTGKAEGIGVAYAVTLVLRIVCLNLRERLRIERVGKIHHEPAKQRAEAGIEMIETRVDEPERNHLYVPGLAQTTMTRLPCANAMSSPQ